MKQLNLLVLRCADIEQSRRFYEALGMTFVRHSHGSGPEHYAHEDERGVFELYPAKHYVTSTDATGLGFATSDLEGTRAALAEYEPAEVRQTEWGRSFVVRDPDGRRVEIKQTSS